MVRYIYADIVLIENLFMNYIILLSTAKLLKSSYKKVKLMLASSIGAIYSVFYYIPRYEFLYTWFLKLIFSLFIIIIAFTPYKFNDLLRLIGIFYIVSFIYGGAVFGIVYLVYGNEFLYDRIFYINSYPFKLLVFASVIAYFIIRYFWDHLLYRIKREKVFTKIMVCFDNQNALLTALVDTGNSLNDPISKLPVVVAEYSSIKGILPKEIQGVFDMNSENNLNTIAYAISKSEWLNRFRIIPFKSLGNDNAIMIGFRPDKFSVDNIENISKKEIIVGIYNRSLSNDGEYSALIHPDILSDFNGGDING